MKKHAVLLPLLLLFSLASQHAAGQCVNPVNHWEACVRDTQQWSYLQPTANVAGWTSPNFNAAAWNTGQGGMGFGDGDDNTVLPLNTSMSVYMRRTFTIVDTSVIHSVILAMDFDDGFIAYLNGVEIARANLNGTPNWNTPATASHEALLYQNQQPDYYFLSTAAIDSLLKPGTNVLAVEVHNQTLANTDLTSRPFLLLGLTNAALSYMPVPAWFIAPQPLYTNLPIVSIQTFGQTIQNAVRITGRMGIIDNGPGNMNCIYDPMNGYDGKISIEIRGASSAGFPKKSYGFSTLDAAGADSNVTLLGMPIENDWALHSPYTDKTFMRNALMYSLARDMQWYSSRARFVEVIINGQYKGVSVLMEKIKQDDGRVNIAKLTSTMNSGDSLTGGYIYKIDWSAGNNGGGFSTNYNVNIRYHDPKNPTTAQGNYLQQYVNSFESSLTNVNAETGYRKRANVFSFADFLLMQEFARNLDGYRASNYIHKDRDSRCGRFTMGPFWDFDIALGNSNFCNGDMINGWQLYNGCGDGSNLWIEQMMLDPWFKNLVHCRYQQWRQSVLSKPALFARIDSFRNELDAAHVRDSAVWKTIGIYLWPNQWTPNNWYSEIDSMKSWISQRLDWMDANIWPATQACGLPSGLNVRIDEINFHSDDTRDAGDWFELYNAGNTPADLSYAMILDGDRREKYCVLPANTILNAGQRLVVYADSLKFVTRHPSVSNKFGPLCFKLSNLGQTITLVDKDQKQIFTMTYSDAWQCTADGNGRTLEFVQNATDPNLPASWFTGCMGGSPGTAYAPCNENPIYSEINYNSLPAADAGDWIELHNRGNTALVLGGWTLRDGSDNNPSFVIPAGTQIAPNGYLVLYQDGTKFSTRFPATANKVGPLPFGLSSAGDVMRLYDAAGQLHYSVCYHSTAPWPTEPNGLAKTLENGQYAGNHNDPLTWFAGCPEGSPGKAYNPQCWPVGVQEVSGTPLWSLYPVPATDHICWIGPDVKEDLLLHDATGKLIRRIAHDERLIQTDHLPSGVYFLSLYDESGRRNVLRLIRE